MKQFLSIILVLSSVLSFTLSGCTNDENKTVSQEALIDYSKDMQIVYSGSGTVTPMTKSDKGYYYVGEDRIIIYIDSKTQKATPLCAKPDCMHDNSETCDAYVNLSENISMDSLWGSLGTAIQYYDGNLYMVCGEYDKSMIEYQTYLMKMDEDGTNRQKITDYFDKAFTNWFIHQGYFYYTSDSSILRIPLSSPKSEPETIYKAKYFIEDNENTFKKLCAYKKYLYCLVDECNEEGEGDGRQSVCINLETLEKSYLKIDDNCDTSFGAFLGDTMIISSSDGNEKTFCKCDLEGKNAEKITVPDGCEKQSLTGDGKYYYFNNMALAAMSYSEENTESKQIITVCDEDMNVVDTFKLPQMDTTVYNFFSPQDENYFLFESFNDSDEHLLVMADKSQIGSIGGKTIEYKELCKLKWADSQNNEYAIVG